MIWCHISRVVTAVSIAVIMPMSMLMLVPISTSMSMTMSLSSLLMFRLVPITALLFVVTFGSFVLIKVFSLIGVMLLAELSSFEESGKLATLKLVTLAASVVAFVASELLVVAAVVERVVELGLLAELILMVSVLEAFSHVTFMLVTLLAKLGSLVTFAALVMVSMELLGVVMAFAVLALCIGVFGPVVLMLLSKLFAFVTFVAGVAFDSLVAFSVFLAVAISGGQGQHVVPAKKAVKGSIIGCHNWLG